VEFIVSTEKKKRTYDAARSKDIILDAAEELFAELGYSATRIDAIASAAGYNKSLIYQYFQDKLGLYTEVVKRAEQLGNQMLAELAGDLMSDETATSDPAKFKRLLEQVIDISYRILSENPRYLKIYSWEAAEEWKTWRKISYPPDDISQFYELALAAKKNGILRKDMDPIMFPIFMMNAVIPFLQSFNRFNDFMDNLKWSMSQERFKEQIVKFVINGVMEPSRL
jgi:TetR/AcrR family transcriptional regulator